jgi:hypothetical protein
MDVEEHLRLIFVDLDCRLNNAKRENNIILGNRSKAI